MNKEEKITISVNEEDIQNLINCYEKDIKYIKQLEQERDKYKSNAEKLEKIILELYEKNKELLNHLAIDKIKELEDRSVNND